MLRAALILFHIENLVKYSARIFLITRYNVLKKNIARLSIENFLSSREKNNVAPTLCVLEYHLSDYQMLLYAIYIYIYLIFPLVQCENIL